MKPKLFRSPYHTDWTVWLGLLAIVAVLSNPIMRDSAIDIIFGVGFQWCLFAVVPAAIRRSMAERNPKVRGGDAR